jgi:hypothetical protein
MSIAIFAAWMIQRFFLRKDAVEPTKDELKYFYSKDILCWGVF